MKILMNTYHILWFQGIKIEAKRYFVLFSNDIALELTQPHSLSEVKFVECMYIAWHLIVYLCAYKVVSRTRLKIMNWLNLTIPLNVPWISLLLYVMYVLHCAKMNIDQCEEIKIGHVKLINCLFCIQCSLLNVDDSLTRLYRECENSL